MKDLLEKINKYANNFDLTFENLGDFVYNYPWNTLDIEPYKSHLTLSYDYARLILQEHPIEVVLLRWPPKQGSAIHYHEGFWGYVIVLEAVLQNTLYTWLPEKKLLREREICYAYPCGIIPEPEDVVHDLFNPTDQDAYSLHIYYPPLTSLEDMKIFQLETGTIGILGADAPSASWKLPPHYFKALEKNAFTYQPFEAYQNATHRLSLVLPKPDSNTIRKMITEYYEEQASKYNFFDLTHEKRSRYTSAIDQLIANDIKQLSIQNLLDVAGGTGRRAHHIQLLSNQSYHVTVIDLSPTMVEQAKQFGFDAIATPILEFQPSKQFDIITFLYAFGHIPTHAERKQVLQKLHSLLKPGGFFYLDVFNLDDETEWGPKIKRLFFERHLHKQNYELGDVFYKKVGGSTIAYLHYFSKMEIVELLTEAGFQVEWIKHIGYANRSGELFQEESKGNFFIKARKV